MLCDSSRAAPLSSSVLGCLASGAIDRSHQALHALSGSRQATAGGGRMVPLGQDHRVSRPDPDELLSVPAGQYIRGFGCRVMGSVVMGSIAHGDEG